MVGGRDDVTLLDIADKLLDTGVSLSGEATISVADVDLIYLGLNVALTSVDKVRERGTWAFPPAGAAAAPAARAPDTRASGGSAHNVPSGPGAMSAALHREEAAALRRDLERVRADLPERVDVDPDDVERGLAKLVLTIVEFVRQLLERQAVRRMQAGTLTEAEVERVGVALERLDRKVVEMAGRFGLARGDLALRLGPLGDLL